MRKIFSILAAISLASFVNAQNTYEVGNEANDNEITISINSSDNKSAIPLQISLTNPTQAVDNIAMYLDIPAEIKIAQQYDEDEEEYFDWIVPSSRCNKKNNQVIIQRVTGGTYEGKLYVSIAANTATAAAFKNAEGEIVTIYFDASDLADGEYIVKAIAPEAYVGNDTYCCAEVENPFIVKGGTVTGINGISVEAQNAKYYSVNGAIQNGPQKGVNIVKYADGKVKKVIIK